MESSTATLFKLFQSVRDSIRNAIGERHRTIPAPLFKAMSGRWIRLTMPAIRVFQALLAGTYRPRPPRAAPQANAATPRAQRPSLPEEMQSPYWLIRLLPWCTPYRYSSAGGHTALNIMVAHPGLPDLLEQAPVLRFHLRRLCRRLYVNLPDILRAPAKPVPQPPPEPPAEPALKPPPERVATPASFATPARPVDVPPQDLPPRFNLKNET